MSDPKYNKYNGTVRFDDDNIVDIDLEPDTENIRVLLNGSEVTGGSGSNVMVITITVDETTDPWTVLFDKTAAQVNAHLAADVNNLLRFKWEDGDGRDIYYEVSSILSSGGTLKLTLYSIEALDSGLIVYLGAVNIGSDSITWDDTLGGDTTGKYPGATKEFI